MNNEFENLYFIDSFKKVVKTKKIQACSKLITRENLLFEENSHNVFARIFFLARNKDSIEALLCLRCRVSRSINNSISKLYKKHSEIYEIDYLKMMSYVLDDKGETKLKFLNNEKEKNNQTVFKWSNVIKIKKNILRPFGLRVLLDFNSELSNIDTWTFHKVRSNSELKSYLISLGLSFHGTWSLIADQSSSRISQAWRFYVDGSINNSELEIFHKSYVENYKKSKSEYRKRKKTMMGWHPDYEFLQSLTPKQSSTEMLEKIADSVRKLLAAAKGAPQNFRQLEGLTNEELFLNRVYEEPLDIESDTEEKIINLIRLTIREASFEVIKDILKSEKVNWKKDETRKLAWILYSDGLSQREIAKRCDHKQGWVSKLIKEKVILERVSLIAAIKLKEYVEFEALKNEPNKIDNLIMQLQDYLIARQPDSELSVLKSVIKEVLVK